jgi:hypothetical protein
LKPLFTVHAGEFLVDHEIQRNFAHVNVWIPTRDTGIDLLVSNSDNTAAISLQVKFSRDYLVTHLKHAVLLGGIRACGWWTPTRQHLEKSRAQYWIFVLVGFANRSTDFIIIRPSDLLERLSLIHGKLADKFQMYLWVTQQGRCYETRNLKQADQLLIATNKFQNDARDFTGYLNDWTPITALNEG